MSLNFQAKYIAHNFNYSDHRGDMNVKKAAANHPSIAIIGMGCIFPKSRNLKEFWQLLYHGTDAIEEIPDSTHWKLNDYFDPDPSTPDHTYCRRGGFLPSMMFDPLAYGIPPNNLEATDTSQLLGLEVARMALEDAGYPAGHPFLEKKKVNVILGVTGTQELVIPLGARLGHPIWKKALNDSGISKEKKLEIIERIQSGYVEWQENSFPGLLGNVVAGRIANRLNLSGTNSVADAACASSLSAIHMAVMELCSGKCDMSISGGVDTLNDIFMHMCFSKTGVLSHTSDARPFSKDADGTVLGEGIGMLVLKRLEDAKMDKDRIYAVIKGVGTSSDGRTSAIYAPDAMGQLKALREAYQEAGVDPSTVAMVEAHGTGTRVGDKVEFDALKSCFDPCSAPHRTAIGSVKSMIGHTKAAAGAAGIIKAALGLHNKIILPTIKAQEPDPDLKMENSSFYLNAGSKPWLSPLHPRRAGVSAFGFGGSNFHMVLEESDESKHHISWDGSIQIIAFSSDTKEDLLSRIHEFQTTIPPNEDLAYFYSAIAEKSHESRLAFDYRQTFRLLLIYTANEDILSLFDTARESIQTGQSSANVYFSSRPRQGKLGFLFPGQGSQYTGMGKDLICFFPEALETLNAASRCFLNENPDSSEKTLQDYIYPPPLHVQPKDLSETELRDTRIAQPAIGSISAAFVKILNRFSVTPDMTCGHSFGELVALYSAGWMDEEVFFLLSTLRGKYMALAKSLNGGDSGSMLAVQAPLETIESLIIEESLNLVLANKNGPSQGVLSGPTDEILKAQKICKQKKLRAIKLPVAAAFHSQLIKEAILPFKSALASHSFFPTKIDVCSNSTGLCYEPADEKIKQLLGDQPENPVNFIDNISNMYEKGVSLFIELGPKSVLTDLTKSILAGKDITAVPLDASTGKSSGIRDLAHVLCTLASKGFPVDLSPWEEKGKKTDPKRMKIPLTGANPKPADKSTLLEKTPEDTTPIQKPEHQANQSRTNEPPLPPVKGHDMKSSKPLNTIPSHSFSAIEAMKMVEKGLEAIQQLQTQTAKAHEKFLETQAEAGKTLAKMLEQTRSIAISSLTGSTGVNSEYPAARPVIENTEASGQASDQFHGSGTSFQTYHTPEEQAPEKVPLPDKPVAFDIPSPSAPASDKSTEKILFEIVSRLTGFPSEMLEPGMDIESDLGIDSIKKVEIVSELEKQLPGCEGITTESMSLVKTLEDICLAIGNRTSSTIGNMPQTTGKNHEANDLQQKVSAALITTISDLTGFPSEMIEPSMNLESDLGIDSIKRVEILSRLEQELDHIREITSEDMGRLKTIQEIIDFIAPKAKKGPIASSLSPETPLSEKPFLPEMKESLDPDLELSRKKVVLQRYPTNEIRFYNGAKITVPKNRAVYLTKDSSGIAHRFAEEFKKLGISSRLINIKDQNIPECPDACGIVIIPDAFAQDAHGTSAIEFLKSSFLFIKANAHHLMESSREKGAFFSVVSFLGGGFGFDAKPFSTDPVFSGLAGLVKTARLEWKNVLCRALDLPDSKEKALLHAEAAVSLLMTQGEVEMGLDDDYCNIPHLIEKDIETVQDIDLTPSDVIVITGGARGVTAACAIELALKHSPTMILIGRTHIDHTEPLWAKPCQNPADLKKAIRENQFKGLSPKPLDIEKEYQKIISAREIRANIREMEQYGARVKYFCADIRSSDEINTIFKTVRNQFGAISAIIHGAGVIDDKLIVDKPLENFTRVFDTKIKGLEALMSACRCDELKYFALFSSIAARTGNQGQCDYAMANEILNKTAQNLSKAYPKCRILSINWGPWEGGMVNESLKKEFLKKSIPLIPLKKGAQAFLKEMGGPVSKDPETVIGGYVHETEKPQRESKLLKAMGIKIGMDSSPILNSHQINGEPVVPFALLMELFARASEKNNPGLVFSGMEDIRLLKGIRPGQNDLHLDINLGKCKPEGNKWVLLGNISSKHPNTHEDNIHSGCRIILRNSRPAPPVISKEAFLILSSSPVSADDAYNSILFHGKEMQSITSINGYADKGIEIITQLSPQPDQWLKNYPGSSWVTDPMMLDAAFQAAIIWCHRKKGQVCLPSFIASFRLYSSFNTHEGPVRIVFIVSEETKNKITGYFTFLDNRNNVIASITGFEAITDPLLTEKFRKKKPLFNRERILAFAQGMPSDAFGEKYKIFDKDRQIARLPRPPYFFMDRVLSADHPQWKLAPGGWIETEYDIPENAWYFTANRTETLPFCILLEIALQPCGWLAAYAGSALESKERLHFRNLGGKAVLSKPLNRHSGTLAIKTRMTDVSKAGGMIIQEFDIEVLSHNEMVYQGKTNFGFFTGAALSNQIGIRSSKLVSFPEENIKQLVYEFLNDTPVLPGDDMVSSNTGMPSKALRMIDRIEVLDFESGLYNKGYVKATKTVDTKEWFFDAHFYQDPVCPGSLGIESFLQVIRFFMLKKFGLNPEKYESCLMTNTHHEWVYRGQIVPTNKQIEIIAHIKDASNMDTACYILADGALRVDGICIYEMKNFGISFNKTLETKKGIRCQKTDLS